MDQKGNLRVQVYTGQRALPIKDAYVSVYLKDGESRSLAAFRRTDADGNTEYIEIDTPDVELSLKPQEIQPGQNEELPYTAVDVQVDKEEYFSVSAENVQVFSGQSAVLAVNLIPLPLQSVPVPAAENSYSFDITPQSL